MGYIVPSWPGWAGLFVKSVGAGIRFFIEWGSSIVLLLPFGPEPQQLAPQKAKVRY